MVAFLTVDVLRAPAAPAFPHAMFGHMAASVSPRPMLGARWLVAPNGRLTCRRQTGGSTPFGIPPD